MAKVTKGNETSKRKIDRPSGYTILPAHVRYSGDISWFEKVLFAELENLARNYGYAWITNGTLAEYLGVTPRYIRAGISNLEKNGFIAIHFDDGRRMISIKTQPMQIEEGVNDDSPGEEQMFMGEEQMFRGGGTYVPGGRNIRSSNEKQIEKQIKKQTHTQQNCENGKPVSAGVCDFEKNEEEEFKDGTDQLDVSLNSEEKKRKSSAKKKRKTAADVLAYCEQKGIALPELAEYTARNITQYVRGIAGSDKTAAGAYRKAIARFPENPGMFRLIEMWAQKQVAIIFSDDTSKRAADLIPPADDATAWKIWFAGVWASIGQYRDSYNANRPETAKAVYTPPVQRSYR